MPPSPRRARTPTVFQMEAVECGAACLGMILGYHGRYVPLEELRVRCGVSRDGVTAGGIARAAAGYGLAARGWRRTPEELRATPVPAVLHWSHRHFVVLEGIRGTVVHLNDPASGPRSCAWDELDECFTGVVLTFEPGPDFRAGGRRPGLRAALRQRARGLEPSLLYLCQVGLLLVVPGLAIPVLTRVFIDHYLVGGQAGWLRPLLLLCAAALALQGALLLLQQRYLLRLEGRLRLTGAARFMTHVLGLPATFFLHRSPGDVSDRIGLQDQIAGFLSRRLATALIAVATALLYAGVMLAFSPGLALVPLAAALLLGVLDRTVRRRHTDLGARLQTEIGALAGALVGGLGAIETVKATGAEGDVFGRWAGHLARVTSTEQELGAERLFFASLPAFLTLVTHAAVLAAGGWMVTRGEITVGTLVAFQALAVAFMTPVGQLLRVAAALQDMVGAVTRVDDVFRTPAEVAIAAPEDAGAELTGSIALDRVSFGYASLAPPLVSDLSLDLRPGARVALVGGSGSGKSTVARLAAGLHAPWSGVVRLGGAPLPEVPRRERAQALGLVDQEIVLFDGTIRENLTLWDPTAPEDRLVEACRDALVHEVILGRPGGYDAPVEHGGRNFSGGERQRLELARALVTGPRVLILDEATSALDPLTEATVDRNLRRRGCTCLIIAHRLSTIRDADEILVLDAGRVVQRGTHAELVGDAAGVYARLVRSA